MGDVIPLKLETDFIKDIEWYAQMSAEEFNVYSKNAVKYAAKIILKK